MIGRNKVVAIITARGGSKGVPGKNIKVICGKPLIFYSIDSARNSKYIDEVIVSTDNENIANLSKECGAEVPFLRPKELSTDLSPSNLVILHALQWLETNHKKFDLFILLQPTSPLRTRFQIDESLEKFHNQHDSTSLMSITESEKSPYWMKTIGEDDYLKNLIPDAPHYSRRQDTPKTYYLNGAIYISRIDSFLKNNDFNTTKASYYLMDKTSSIDIDTPLDFEIAELLLGKKNES